MDAGMLAAVGGILSIVFLSASVIFLTLLLKRENMAYLPPTVVLLISEAASVFLFVMGVLGMCS